MSKIQTYKGKGKQSGKNYYRIQPYTHDGRRITVRLGTGKKTALKGSDAIYDLIDSRKAHVEPSASSKKWVETIADLKTCKQLLNCGLIQKLPKRYRDKSECRTTISTLADEFIYSCSAGKQESTLKLYDRAKSNLLECFGDVDILSLGKRDGREFWRWLIEDQKYSRNTAMQRMRYASAFFSFAIEDGTLTSNPLKFGGFRFHQTAAEKTYVPWDSINQIIGVCPTTEWKLLFAMTRSVPLRIMSEIVDLKWSDIDWQQNSILIHSPKTKPLGQRKRLVPVFPSFLKYLSRAFEESTNNTKFVFADLIKKSNLGVPARRITRDAGIEPWKFFFNSLRATAETDLMDQYGLRRACMWAGNSPITAMKNYSLVRKSDFSNLAAIKRQSDQSFID